MRFNKDFVLQFGLLYGLIMSAYTLISYLLGVDFMLNWFNIGFSLLLPFGITYYIGVKSREKNGGFITWKESFMELFMVLAAGMFITVAFNFVLNTIIDPELSLKVYDQTVEKTMTMLQDMGSDEATLDETYKRFEEGREEVLNTYTPIGVIKTYFSGLLFAAIVAALIALFVKRGNPNPFAGTE